MIGDPDCGLAVRCVEIWPSLIISPGDGTDGSFSCRFMRTVDRLRLALEGCRRVTELVDEPVSVSKNTQKIEEIELAYDETPHAVNLH